MSKIPFTAYDFFGYLSSGSVVVATLGYMLGNESLFRDITPPLTVAFLFLSYVTGHVVAHFSSLFLEEFFVNRMFKDPTRILMGESAPFYLNHIFRNYYMPLTRTTRERIQQQMESRGIDASAESLFVHARSVVVQDDRTEENLGDFRNLYGFSRNMSFVFFFATILLVIGRYFADVPPSYWWSAASAFLGIAMFYRYLKFFRLYSWHVLTRYSELPRGTE